MDFPWARTGGSSAPPTDGTLGYFSEEEIDDVPSSLPLNPHTFALSHPTPHHHPRFVLAEFDFTFDGSSSRNSFIHPSPPSPNYSSWNRYPSHSIGPAISSPIPGPSEPVVYAAENNLGHNAFATVSQFAPFDEQEHQGHITFPGASMTVPASTSGHAIPANSDAEHVELWNYVLRYAVIVNGPRVFVPQTLYQPHAQGDRRRYVSLATLCQPIIFIREGTPEWGVPVQRLLSNQPVQLVGGHEPAFTSCGPSIGIRLQWPGYQSFHKQVATKDFTRRHNIINKAKLAKVVAKYVMECMVAMSTQTMQVGSDNGRWRVGPSNIRVDDVILVSLHHVSQGSWQPHLRLRREIGTLAAAAPQSFPVPGTGMHS